MELLLPLTEAIQREQPVVLATVVEAPGRPALAGRQLLLGADGLLASTIVDAQLQDALIALADETLRAPTRRTVMCEGVRVYLEPFLPLPELVIAGGGHVAQSLARIGAQIGFGVTVIDDRLDFANATRFPTARRVICEPFIPALRAMPIGPAYYLVLVTRGHRHDADCLEAVIETKAAYIGMIGSRNRIRTIYRLLTAERGVDAHLLQRVHAPIGLDIGARTPDEIALAIGAELLKVRSGGTGRSLSELDRPTVHGR